MLSLERVVSSWYVEVLFESRFWRTDCKKYAELWVLVLHWRRFSAHSPVTGLLLINEVWWPESTVLLWWSQMVQQELGVAFVAPSAYVQLYGNVHLSTIDNLASFNGYCLQSGQHIVLAHQHASVNMWTQAPIRVFCFTTNNRNMTTIVVL